MALRTCPSCGTQYVATVRRCIDCGATLVDDRSVTRAAEAKSTTTDANDRDHVGYELPGWGNQLKTSLDGMLEHEGVPRVWEPTALVVPAEFEATVDRLVEALEGSELPEAGDGDVQVALEIEGLDAEAMDELDARLLAAAIPHAWDDEGALLVAEADETPVLALIDEVFEPVADEDPDDDVDAPRLLSDLFVAVDRLMKRPDDAKLAVAYRAATEPLAPKPVPYGFDPSGWAELVADARGLADALTDTEEDTEPDVDDVEDDDASTTEEPEAADARSEDDAEDVDASEDGAPSTADRARDLRERLVDIV